MRRIFRRLLVFALIISPFLGVAALVHFNVERDIALAEPVTVTIGELREAQLVHSRIATANERALFLAWLSREQAGWKKMWNAPAAGAIAVVLTHRHAQNSVVQLMPEYFTFSSEQGYYFKKIDAARYAEALATIGYTAK